MESFKIDDQELYEKNEPEKSYSGIKIFLVLSITLIIIYTLFAIKDTWFYDLGCKYLNKEDYRKAIICFTIAMEMDSENIGSCLRRALAWYYLGEYDKALDDFQKYILLRPYDSFGFYYRGLLYIKIKQYNDAISDFTKVINLEPDSPDGYYERGKAYFEQGDYKKAFPDLEKSCSISTLEIDIYEYQYGCYELGVLKAKGIH